MRIFKKQTGFLQDRRITARIRINLRDTIMAKTADTKKDAKKKPQKTQKEKKLAKQLKKKSKE